MTEADELLADVRSLRRRARLDRRASAFPLFLFGGLILLAPVTYLPGDPLPPEILDQVYYVYDDGPFPQFLGIGPFVDVKYPGLVGWYWLLTIVLGFAATAWWYRRRAMRVGVETDTRAYLVAAGAALAGFLLGQPVLEELVTEYNSLYSTPEVNLPIMFGAAALSAVVLLWCTNRGRTTVERVAGLFVGVLLGTVAFAALGVYMIYGFAALLVIAAGLLALAWLERNVLLAAIGLVFGGAALWANLYDIQNMFYRLGWYPGQPQVLVLQQVLLPAAVLLVGGVAVAVTGRGAAR